MPWPDSPHIVWKLCVQYGFCVVFFCVESTILILLLQTQLLISVSPQLIGLTTTSFTNLYRPVTLLSLVRAIIQTGTDWLLHLLPLTKTAPPQPGSEGVVELEVPLYTVAVSHTHTHTLLMPLAGCSQHSVPHWFVLSHAFKQTHTWYP